MPDVETTAGGQKPRPGTWQDAITVLQEVEPPFIPAGAHAMTVVVEFPPGDPGNPPHRLVYYRAKVLQENILKAAPCRTPSSAPHSSSSSWTRRCRRPRTRTPSGPPRPYGRPGSKARWSRSPPSAPASTHRQKRPPGWRPRATAIIILTAATVQALTTWLKARHAANQKQASGAATAGRDGTSLTIGPDGTITIHIGPAANAAGRSGDTVLSGIDAVTSTILKAAG
jgi:hypothetical protein